MSILRAIGFMSGTSMDGVDVAMIETDGHKAVRRGPGYEHPYGEDDRNLLIRALEEGKGLTDRTERPGVLAEAENRLLQCHVEALDLFLAREGIERGSIDVLGFHGQTVLHRPEIKLTVQIGDGAALAKAAGIKTVWDLRAADCAAGGQGAPLVPIYHRALFGAAELFGPVAIVNIGGVANVTYLADAVAEPVAFDTGPGNALIDDLIRETVGKRYDKGGKRALAGTPDREALGKLLSHPYFARPFPKSLDRNSFSREAVSHLGVEDAAATLAAFTAMGIALALGRFEEKPRTVVVCGGGGRNAAIMENLRTMPAQVKSAGDMGWSGDFMEAEAFAYLAVRSLKGLPITFPGTTGVKEAISGGVISEP